MFEKKKHQYFAFLYCISYRLELLGLFAVLGRDDLDDLGVFDRSASSAPSAVYARYT